MDKGRKVSGFKVEVRDPYCGAWVPIHIAIIQNSDGEIIDVKLANSENHVVTAHPTDVQ